MRYWRGAVWDIHVMQSDRIKTVNTKFSPEQWMPLTLLKLVQSSQRTSYLGLRVSGRLLSLGLSWCLGGAMASSLRSGAEGAVERGQRVG